MSELKTSRPRIDQAADDLVAYIVQKELKPGDKLPPEHELAGLLSVGRSTLREAVRMLASRNVLEVRHGSGSYVSKKTAYLTTLLGLPLYGTRGNWRRTWWIFV